METFAELAVVGDAVQDEDKVICLLASLPEYYATLVTALEASGSDPTWETITERLLHQESKISRKSNANEENSLLLTKKKSTQKTFKCYESEKGLPEVSSEEIQQWEKCCSEKSSTEKCATAKGDEKLISLFATALPVISDDNNQWIIDSRATRHMAYDKRSFSTLEALKKKITIEIGDGSTINVEGVGKVD